MTEEIQENPIQQEQVIESVEENQSQEAEKQNVQEQIKQESSQDRNWAETRKELKELRKQNEELQQYLSHIHNKDGKKQEDEEISDDDWITQKNLKKQLENLRAEMRAKDAETVMDRLKAKFNDFDDVVTQENVNYLKDNDPELAQSLQALSHDPLQQGIAAYKLLKKTDYYLNRGNMKEKKQIEQNLAKPPSVNQVRKSSALAEANRFDRGLTPELKKQLQQEMQEAIKRA